MIRFDRALALVLASLVCASCQQWMPRSSNDGSGAGSASTAPASSAERGGGRPSSDGSSSAGRSERSQSAPAPRQAALVLPEGTNIPVSLETALSTASSNAGDMAVARVSSNVEVGGHVVVPAGSEVRGRVTTSVRSGKVKGRARLVVAFDTIVVNGHEHPVDLRPIDVTARSGKKKDGAMIAGGAGAGALIGAIADGGHGAGIGALIGAGAGTGAVLLTRGEDVKLPAGGKWSLQVAHSATLG